MKLDLHTHTTASDGQYTPSEIIMLARKKKLEYLAITDHDTVDGIAEAKAELSAGNIGKRDVSNYGTGEGFGDESGPENAYRLQFIPGIEISTQLEEEIHILGFYIDENNDALQSKCKEFMDSRINRGQRICDFLRTKRVEITFPEVEAYAGQGSLGRPHFAQFLQEHGYVKSRQEAFERYLNTREFHEATDRIKPTPQEAIELIHRAGGVAVLAHPGLLKMGKRWQESLIKQLAEAGLDGMECFYHKHTQKQRNYYRRLAEDFRLGYSCGSDFHGEKVKPEVPFGMELDEQYVDKLVIRK